MRRLAFLLLLMALTLSAKADLIRGTTPLIHGVEIPEVALTDKEEELAWKIALVAANEGALWTLKDVTLVHQVVVSNEPDRYFWNADKILDRRIGFLEDHSGKVLGKKPCPESGNCKWVRQLARTAATLPAALARPDSEIKDWKAYWRIEMAPRWQAVMDLSRALVAGEVVEEPCPIRPRTWGSLRTGLPDVSVAASNGLYPIGCKGTLNDGFAPLERWPFWDMGLAFSW